MKKFIKAIVFIICFVSIVVNATIGLNKLSDYCVYGENTPMVKIEQETKINSLINCDVRINTYVWIYNYPKYKDKVIEKAYHKYNVKKEDIEDVKKDQMDRALTIKEKLEQIIENGSCKDLTYE